MDHQKYNYKFSPLAEQDIDEILEYISLELAAPQAALSLIDKIQKANRFVYSCCSPFSRPLLKNGVLRKKGYRILVVQNFNLFYVVEDNIIIIRRVIYGKRNYEDLL